MPNSKQKFHFEHKLHTFTIGELVLLMAFHGGHSNGNTTAKFFRLYNGPFILSEQIGKNTTLSQII